LREVDRDQLMDVLHERQAEVEHRVAVPRCSSLAGPRLTLSYLATLHQQVAQVVEQCTYENSERILVQQGISCRITG
jgi:hypothetical protein